jgi:hypothetical protein
MKSLSQILIILCTAVLSACTEEPEPVPYNYTHIFTGDEKKAWTLRSFAYRETGNAPMPLSFPACVEDDIYIFFANEERRFEVRDGEDKCSPTDPDLVLEWVWEFSNTGATMTIPFPPLTNGVLPFTVMEAEEDRMTLEFYLDNDRSFRMGFRTVDLE